jgi:zinc transporter 9
MFQAGKEMFTSVNGTGIAMLFSAGTFLYVATVHVLPEVGNRGDSSEQSKTDHNNRADLILMVLGICAPLLLSQTHSH